MEKYKAYYFSYVLIYKDFQGQKEGDGLGRNGGTIGMSHLASKNIGYFGNPSFYLIFQIGRK